MSVSGKQTAKLLLVATILGAVFTSLLPVRQVSAAQITSRSLTLQAGTTDGGSKPGGVVKHLFGFTLPNVGGGNIGSIKFEYCTRAANDTLFPSCTTPTGLDTTSATLGDETGATGFSIVNTTNGAPYLTRAASAITAGQAVTYRLDTVTNPTTEGTFFVRISTYASTDTTGSPVDTGSVAASTAEQIILSGVMPESLIFCAGATVSTTNSIPDCSTATAGTVSFDRLFSPSDTSTATSQMAASTNASSGYSITVNGVTLTSGSNTIPAMASATTGARGTGQFGLNLKANTTSTSTPAIGTEVAPAANGTNYKGQAKAGYDTVDTFKFVSGNVVAASDNTGAGPTDSQIFTASYIVNVAGSQPAGTYTSTLTYICTATF
jgi:hypothetical protein